MADKNNKNFEIPRPVFPKRAVITGGMPYGNKELHFGHVGGMFVFADTFARFMRDRPAQNNLPACFSYTWDFTLVSKLSEADTADAILLQN